MSRQLPVPLRPGRSEPRADPPEVIVLESRSNAAQGASAFGKLLLSLTPDLIRVVEQSLAQRNEREKRAASQITPLVQPDMRAYRGGIQLSEVEYDTSLPFLRKVTVRKASAWTSDVPFFAPVAEPASRRRDGLRWAGLVSVGGAVALAALGLLANRIPGLGSRRGF